MEINKLRIGFGFDVHKLGKGESLILGGVKIDSPIGTIAHSDGDVLLHALMDSILGAAGLGDIGEHFPDTDPKFKNVSSMELTKYVVELIKKNGFTIINTDINLILEKPKIKDYKPEMRENISKVLNISIDCVNIKATTNEKMGYIGRSEGIAAQSVCLLINNK